MDHAGTVLHRRRAVGQAHSVLALYDLCPGERLEVDPDEAVDVDRDDLNRDELEAVVFAGLFDQVSDATMDGDRQAAIGPLMDAWGRHDDLESREGYRLLTALASQWWLSWAMITPSR